MREKYLLGATEENELVFGEIAITTRNGYPEFAASFDRVRPFTADEVDATDYYESLIEEMDSKWCWEQVTRFDCSPSELAERLADENGEDVMDIRDCSLYPEIIDVDGTDWYFESGSCGQHDTRGEMAIYTSKNLYNRIHALWDSYHLERVDDDVISEVEAIRAAFENIDEQEWISDFIRTTF